MATNSFVQVPPDSTGKRLASKEHTVDALPVQAQIMHIASGTSASNILSVDTRGAAQVRFTEGASLLTSYGSLKTEQERVIGAYEASIDSYDDLFSIQLASGGTSTYDPVKSSTVLATNTTTGSKVTRTTNRYHYYLPGSSNLVKIGVACGDVGKTNNKRRWGAFDDNDGIFFELDGTDLRVVSRSSTSGIVTETPIPRAVWDDELDGTGVSGLVLDVTKVNNYWADFSFSGAGRVRFGVYHPDGTRIIAYTIQAANSNAYPAIRSATLPLRTENLNTGPTGSSSELREVLMTVSTEANTGDYTFWRSSDMEVYGVDTTTGTHLISMQSINTINGKHNSVQAYPETLSVIVSGGDVAITLWQTTLLTGASWTVGTGDSSILGSTVGTLDTSGARKFFTFFVAAGVSNIDLTKLFELNDEGIMLGADGVAELWSITATKLSGTTVTTGVNLSYRELW